MAAGESDASNDLLREPYRDRQLIMIMRRTGGPVERVWLPFGDYFISWRRNSNPRVLLTRKYWTEIASREFWTDTRNWGIWGYLYDRVRDRVATAAREHAPRQIQRLPADLAERLLTFPPGHPLYETVYVGHPLIPRIYVPLAAFHRYLFEEKFNELLTLLWSLAASYVAITHVTGYRDLAGASAGLELPDALRVELGAAGSRTRAASSGAILEARFKPSSAPFIPAGAVWYQHEPTWRNVARARLDAGLKEIDVELRYDDDFGINASVAAKLERFGFNLGGEFESHQRTIWKFHGAFA